MIKFIVFAALISVALAAGKKCPWIVGKYPFDESKFSGEWNIVGGSPLIGGPNRCGKFDYKITQDIHTIKYTGIRDDGTPAQGEAFGQSVGKGFHSSNYMAVWRKGNEPFSPVFKQAIVASDYDTYALMVGCTSVYDDNSKSFNRVLKAGILARPGKTLSPDQLGVLKTILTGYDFDLNDLKFVEHTGC